jgi:hypothetical protein
VDDFLTIYKSNKTDQLVGCQKKGLLKALKLLGDFGLVIEDGSVRLGMTFLACMAACPDTNAKRRYLELSEVAHGATISAEELQPALI